MKKLAVGAVLWLAGAQAADAALFDISLDTSAYAGAPVVLVFDWTANDGSVNNGAEISSFNADGAFDPLAVARLGDAVGALDATAQLGDGQPFNELSQPMTLGSILSFRLDISSGLFSGVGTPDLFALFLLDAGSGLPLYPTQDSTGNDALLAIEASGAVGAYAYAHASGAGPAIQVVPVGGLPEPSVAWLWLAGAFLARRFVARPPG